ncbi:MULTISPECIES: hypothetical protein [unclassified Saccharicrinis]|uniref:hypothetical protein n=1 Tax=unclassified Saccharicrinis TaxID=2646859 RepID=UPI003D33F687
MSLQTILQIGHVLRNSENSLKYYKYVKPSPVDKEDDPLIFITIPVSGNFIFDWNKMRITPENKRDKLYYLLYKTSSDSSPLKYIFGDIFYSRKSSFDKSGNFKKVDDFGNYTLEKGEKSAYKNGRKVLNSIRDEFLLNTSIEMMKGIPDIESKDYETISKLIAKLYHDKENKVKIPKKFLNKQQYFEKIISKLKEQWEEFKLSKFNNSYGESLNEFELILRYAPLVKDYIENNKTEVIEELFQDETRVKEEYLGWLIRTNEKSLKKIVKKDNTFEDLSEASKNKLLKYANHKVFLHFEFEGGKHWYHFKEPFQFITNKLNAELIETINDDNGKSYVVPHKSIYRTLCSGNTNNDVQTPKFTLSARKKSFYFESKDQFEDFLYTEAILNKRFRTLKNTDIALFVYPVVTKGEQFSVKEFDEFFFEKKDERRLTAEPLIPFFDNKTIKFTRFDFVFADTSGNTVNDMIEISGLDKSTLYRIGTRIENISIELSKNWKKETNSEKEFYFKIENSLLDIMGSYFYDDKKGTAIIKSNNGYKGHLIKTLPLIYSENYYSDEMLLPNVIRKVELAARSDDKTGCFTRLRYALQFLYKIQNSKNDRYMKLTGSASYKIGVEMGKMAKPLKNAIGSFEKSYVGLLSRRVKTLEMCRKFLNEIDEKLVLHDKNFTRQVSASIRGDLADMVPNDYDENALAFGFFEGYYKYEARDEVASFVKTIEKLIAAIKDSEMLASETQKLTEILETIQENKQ